MRIHVPAASGTEFNVALMNGIVEKVSREKYGGNLVVSSSRQVSNDSVQLLVEVQDHDRPGAYLGESRHHAKGACWHAFQDILTALYEAYPEARVTTGIARYHHRTHFLASGDATKPLQSGLCQCPEEDEEAI